ncbi:MAG: complex I subunit 1/NuoH family protein, partial [Chloroflexota bacterium]
MDVIFNIFGILNDLTVSVLGPWLPYPLLQVVLTIGAIIILFAFLIPTVMILVYMERKVIGRIQDRYGPNRVGPFGIFQSVADVAKLFIKEDITPAAADKLVFQLAPAVVLIPAVAIYVVFSFAPGVVIADLTIGLLFVIAISSLATVGVFMAGWGSNNKYALLGGMRAVAQMVSYEVPLGLAVLGVVMISGTLSLNGIVAAQNSIWFVVVQPVAFVIYFIAAIAEVKRSPFDIAEAESEIVAGFHIEYSGMRFALFFLAEFLEAFAISALAVMLFLGGWQGLPILDQIIPPYI